MELSRFGLTLVELLVVLCVSGLLLSVSFPAIQLGKEEARRVECLDNLESIAKVATVYDGINGELPPFMGLPFNPANISDVAKFRFDYQQTGSLTQLLPLIGESDLANQLDPFAFNSIDATLSEVGYPVFGWWVNGTEKGLPGVAAAITDVEIGLYLCPSDVFVDSSRTFFGPQPTNAANAAASTFPSGKGIQFSITNYVANVGGIWVTDTPDLPEWDGLFGPIRSRQADSVDSIPDGASNVLLFGESLGAIDFTAGNNFRYSMVLGGLACGRGDIYRPDDKVLGDAVDSSWVQFGSAHPDVVNIVRADGSTRSIRRTILSVPFGRMCGSADGLPIFRGQIK